MALVAATPAFKATISLLASNGKTMPLNLSLTAGIYTDAVTDLVAFLTDLAAVSAGVVKAYTISSTAVENAVVLPTSDDAEYGEKAMLTGNIEGNPLKSWTLYIPMPKIGIFEGPGIERDDIDKTDADLMNYVANFTSVGNVATVSDGEFVDLLLGGKRL